MSKGKIVVVEDEPGIRRGVADALRLAGYEVTEAMDGVTGATLANSAGVHLVLLDLMLPRKNGLEVLQEVRRNHPHRPVVLLTARGSEEDRVKGLTMGADDYVVKPFSVRELLARVEAVLRRTTPNQSKSVATISMKCGTGTIDLARRELRWPNGQRIELSETEAGLLRYIIENQDRAVSREELLQHVWGISPEGLETRTVDMHVARLRAKLRDPSGEETPEAIVTVRARGYMAGPAISLPV
ncbi:MAG: response regulator transcription factor [Gemmataceae bacterium]|jgi:DNA-binding response OmpR family regulator|nr:response regulator transcription factor [Gemmataceae bacterium]